MRNLKAHPITFEEARVRLLELAAKADARDKRKAKNGTLPIGGIPDGMILDWTATRLQRLDFCTTPDF